MFLYLKIIFIIFITMHKSSAQCNQLLEQRNNNLERIYFQSELSNHSYFQKCEINISYNMNNYRNALFTLEQKKNGIKKFQVALSRLFELYQIYYHNHTLEYQCDYDDEMLINHAYWLNMTEKNFIQTQLSNCSEKIDSAIKSIIEFSQK